MLDFDRQIDIYEIMDFMVIHGTTSPYGETVEYQGMVLTADARTMTYTLTDTNNRVIFEYDALANYITISDIRILDSIHELFDFDLNVMYEEGNVE